jgi:lipid-A-disaccharide synthase
MLCLLPFEKQFYDSHQVQARFVGHPLADQIPLHPDRAAARSQLGLAQDALCIAVLPGSRQGEVSQLGQDFAQTIAWLKQHRPQCQIIAPMANAGVRALFTQALQQAGMLSQVILLDGHAQQAMIASDAVLLVSGTATLEAALVKRPMVVAYRIGKLTTWLLKGLGIVKFKYFSQPNILTDQLLVPEFYNDEVRPEVLGSALLAQLDRADREQLDAAFMRIHLQLKQHASEQAAAAIAELLAVARP